MSQKIAGAFALPNFRSCCLRPTFIFFNSFFWYLSPCACTLSGFIHFRPVDWSLAVFNQDITPLYTPSLFPLSLFSELHCDFNLNCHFVYMICRYGLPQNQVGNCDYLSCAMLYFVIVSYFQSFLDPIFFCQICQSMPIDSFFKTLNYQLIHLFTFTHYRFFVGPLCPILQSLELWHSSHLEFFFMAPVTSLSGSPVSGFPCLPVYWLTLSCCRIIFSSGFLRKDKWEPIIVQFRNISEMSILSLIITSNLGVLYRFLVETQLLYHVVAHILLTYCCDLSNRNFISSHW